MVLLIDRLVQGPASQEIGAVTAGLQRWWPEILRWTALEEQLGIARYILLMPRARVMWPAAT